MAHEDQESSPAEDRAWDNWSYDDASPEARRFLDLEDRDDQWEHIFRQGFRAGQEHPRHRAFSPTKLVDHEQRLSALENERARNITALVEQNVSFVQRLEALEFKVGDMFSGEAQADLESRVSNVEELTKRIETTLQQRPPRPIPIVTPLTQQQADRMQQSAIEEDVASGRLVPAAPALALPDYVLVESTPLSKARIQSGGPCPCGDQEQPEHPVGWCAEQDAKRAHPARPALHGDITQHGLAPDYSSERPAEVERCSCEESESLREEVRLLRAELGSASLELRQMAGRAEEAVRERDEARAYAVSCSTQAQTLSAQLKQIRAVVAEAYTAPSRAKLREHAWRYLDAARDILAEQPAAPATPDSGALYARSEEPAQCKCPGCRNGRHA